MSKWKVVERPCSYCKKETEYPVWQKGRSKPLHYACSKRKERAEKQAKWSLDHVMRG